jgi:methylenetetrahydrofolate dehydrogenase (NADP+)/methenyltetrahydrofolate cyclohydrolase
MASLYHTAYSATLNHVKLLNGSELVGYIKERQAKQVRALRQAHAVFPKLAIIMTGDSPASLTYTRLKQVYGQDILVDVDIHKVAIDEVAARIETLNADDVVHGIVLQLPLTHPEKTDELVALIAPEKDVDGLGPDAHYISATVTAIDWLLAGYNIALQGANIVVVGMGRLVGGPLVREWEKRDLQVEGCDESIVDLTDKLRAADIVVTATGVPGLIRSQMLSPGVVVVDAGTASEGGVLVGDVAPEVRERNDVTITPEKGGVGPLTVAALIDNVIQAAQATAKD